MNVLLLSMPDSFEHTPSLAMRMPNGALASLAGNIDAHHRVAIGDLVLAQRSVPDTVTRLLQEHQPDVVGLSVMTFQRTTARKVAALVRRLRPAATIVLGGYDPSLAPHIYEDPSVDADVIVRGEGDLTFRDLLRALESRAPLDAIPGLSWRTDRGFVRHRARPVSHLTDEVKPPTRAARVDATFWGGPLSASSRTSATRMPTAPARFSSSTTTSRWISSGSGRCAMRSSRKASPIFTTSSRG